MLQDPKVGAIVFYVKDMKRAEAFYRDTLGLQTQMNPGHAGEEGYEGPWMLAKAANLSLIFFTRDEPVGRTPIVVFTLADGGIDQLVEQLAEKGVKIVTPVSEAPGGWTADFLDPDGHWLSFYQNDKAPRRR